MLMYLDQKFDAIFGNLLKKRFRFSCSDAVLIITANWNTMIYIKLWNRKMTFSPIFEVVKQMVLTVIHKIKNQLIK